jgi:predicted nucleic acid-binding protein
MAGAFLDTNIILRHLLNDHPEHSPRATAFLESVRAGEMSVHTADTVVFECVFTLERFYRLPKARIRDVILPLFGIPGIVLPGKRRYRKVFDLYVGLNLPFADAYHAVRAEHLKVDYIVSIDRDFDRVPGIRRLEP